MTPDCAAGSADIENAHQGLIPEAMPTYGLASHNLVRDRSPVEVAEFHRPVCTAVDARMAKEPVRSVSLVMRLHKRIHEVSARSVTTLRDVTTADWSSRPQGDFESGTPYRSPLNDDSCFCGSHDLFLVRDGSHGRKLLI
jgi:hypothetical protein